MKKIAIFRALQLGDMLCAIPAIRALRTARPKAHITLLGLPWAATLVQRFPHYFNAFVHFPGYPGLPEQATDVRALPAFLAAMQAQRFDLVVQMQGNGSIVNPLVALMGARYTAGFWRREDYCPDPDRYLEYPQQAPEVMRHLLLMEHLGIPAQGTWLEFPLTPQDYAAYEALQLPLIQPYVCIHPGSRGSWRQWPPAAFATVGDYLARQGFQVVITGTAEERSLAAAVAAGMQHPALITAGHTSLGAMAVLLKHAGCLVANCTGVSHLADALQTPSVIISMDGEAARWAPMDQGLHRTVDWTRRQDIREVLKEVKAVAGMEPSTRQQ